MNMKKYKLMDKKTAYIDRDVVIEEGAVIGPNVSLRGKTVIGADSVIDANTIIKDSIIGKNNYIISSVIEKGNVIGDNNNIGPFTHLREDNKIGNFNEIGSYVEAKGSVLGNHNKAKHLSYLGNAILGDNINIGAGVIFANYHSKKKLKESTKIEDNVSIGSNCTIVAPVTIKKGAFIGAGTVVRKDVIEEDSLYFSTNNEVYKEKYYQEDKGDKK